MKDTGKGAVYLPHTAGRYAARRFRKAQVCGFSDVDNSVN